jgi:chromosome partitioning protein
MKKVMLGNFKGGVGKTVSVVSLAHALKLLNQRVLLVDADPQGNSSNWLEPDGISFELADVIVQKCDFPDAIVETKQGFNIVATFPDGDLRNVSETELNKKPFLFEDMFSTVESDYDFLLVDTSPSFSPLERSICLAADEVICPVELEFFAVDGLGQFDRDIQVLNKNWRRNTKLEKIILTKENKSYSRHKLLQNTIIKKSGYKFYIVRQDALIAESIGLNKTIFERNKNAKSAIDYMNIARGML